MPRSTDRRPNFRARDVTRAVTAVTTAGQVVDKISIDPRSGRIDVIVARNVEPEPKDAA